MNFIYKILSEKHSHPATVLSARDEFTGEASVFLDANENPFNALFNRYPDPRQLALKNNLAGSKIFRQTASFWATAATSPSICFSAPFANQVSTMLSPSPLLTGCTV